MCLLMIRVLSDEAAEQRGVSKVELEELFKNADYITLHIPKTEENQESH